MIVYPNSKCRLCGGVMEEMAQAMSLKGTGAIHIICFDNLCDFAAVIENNIIAQRQLLFKGLK